MADIYFSEIHASEDADKFWAARGRAIKAFADLEQAVCRVFEGVTGIEMEIAKTIFFKISSTRSQSDLVQTLLGRLIDERFRGFYRFILRRFEELSKYRNCVVHWNFETVINKNALSFKPSLRLVGQDHSAKRRFQKSHRSASIEGIEIDDLLEFHARCDFFAEALRQFAMDLKSNHDLKSAVEPWRSRYLTCDPRLGWHGIDPRWIPRNASQRPATSGG